MAGLPGEGLNVKVAMKMPDLSSISASVTVVRWLVAIGGPVRRGEPLLEVETDKANMVVESPMTGTLTAIAAQPAQEVPTGAVIATIDTEDAAIDAAAPAATQPIPDDGSPLPIAPRPTRAAPGAGGSFFARNRQAAQEPGDATGRDSNTHGDGE